MIKSLQNFIVAIVLIVGAKLIEVNFYHILKIPSKDKEHKEKVEEPPKDELDQVIEYTVESDSATQSDAIPADSVIEEQTAEPFESSSDSNGQDDSVTNEPQAENSMPDGDDYFQDLKNSYLSPILASLPEGRSREDVVIRYYKHENDGDRVYALKELGYYLHEREAENNMNLPSNSLYYGSDVDLRDIKLVAYTLLKEGMPLKAIKRSAYDWKFNALEIGADSLVQNNAILSVSDIELFQN